MLTLSTFDLPIREAVDLASAIQQTKDLIAALKVHHDKLNADGVLAIEGATGNFYQVGMKNVATTNVFMPGGYASYVPGGFEIASGVTFEIGADSVLEIG